MSGLFLLNSNKNKKENQNQNQKEIKKDNSKKFTYLSLEERDKIEKLLKENKNISNRKIAKILWRSHTTIWEELNKYFYSYSYEKIYKSEKAHNLFLNNQNQKWNKSKLIDYKEEWEDFKYKKLKDFIINKLKKWYSPEQISWRIKKLKLQSELWWNISHETIYRFIYYSEEWKTLKLYKNLRRHRKKQIKYWTRKWRSKWWSIKNLIWIKERDKDLKIKNREDLWHWETDSIIFSNQKNILSVQIERRTRFVHITKLEDKTANKTLLALNDLYNYANNDISRNWLNIVKSISFDRWTEWAYHYKLNKKYWIKTYFCNPYSSRQKWWVENINMFIREYFPRNTNMKNITDDEIKKVQDILNNRPRKCLGFLTPKESLEKEINKKLKNNCK